MPINTQRRLSLTYTLATPNIKIRQRTRILQCYGHTSSYLHTTLDAQSKVFSKSRGGH
jgi:hypothetical protein